MELILLLAFIFSIQELNYKYKQQLKSSPLKKCPSKCQFHPKRNLRVTSLKVSWFLLEHKAIIKYWVLRYNSTLIIKITTKELTKKFKKKRKTNCLPSSNGYRVIRTWFLKLKIFLIWHNSGKEKCYKIWSITFCKTLPPITNR